MSTFELVVVGGMLGLVAVALYKWQQVRANPYAVADANPGTPLPPGVFGPPVPAVEGLA